MSYGANMGAVYRQAAAQVVAILGGAIPAEVGIEAPAEMELVVNLNAARYLGVDVPEGVLSRADEVIG